MKGKYGFWLVSDVTFTISSRNVSLLTGHSGIGVLINVYNICT